jgi:glycosidase
MTVLSQQQEAQAQIADPPKASSRDFNFNYASIHDLDRIAEYEEREADWRNGALIYQVIVDRFAPPADLDAKRHLYPEPKIVRSWDEKPKRGQQVEGHTVWSHEIEFWGGDLQSLLSKLDYIDDLGIDVLYLNPIHQAFTNHKYDALDYTKISPEYGTKDDVKELAEATHQLDMKLMFDGVFNHMGANAPIFQEALANPDSPWRDWFYIDPSYEPHGYRAWYNVPNLPEINLENPDVRAHIYASPDSVIQSYLRLGVDGWRLDVAYDIGFEFLSELTRAAHHARPGSLVIGEIWNYPEEWSPAVDGVMNMSIRELVLQYLQGNLTGGVAGRNIERMVEDAGIEPLLKAWFILDNHDTQRLATAFDGEWRQRMAQVLQFTLPGSPCIYYGVELGMQGGDDPEQRGPMRWDLVSDDNPHLQWMRSLIQMRKDRRGLRIGDFRLIDTDQLLAFMRRTARVEDLTIVIANATDKPVKELVMLRDSKLMSSGKLLNILGDEVFYIFAGTVTLEVPPQTIYVLAPQTEDGTKYTPYKRVR